MSTDRAFTEGRFCATLTIRLLDGSREQALQHRNDLVDAIEANGWAAVIAATLEGNDGTSTALRTLLEADPE